MIRLSCLLSLLLTTAASGVAPPRPDPLPVGARLRIGTARLRHGGLARGLAFAPDSKSLASVGHDQTVSLWEVPGGRELFRFRGHQGDVLAIAFSPDGKVIASGGSDGTVRLWAVRGPRAGHRVHLFPLPSDNCEALAFDPTGKWLALGNEDGTVRVIALESRKDEASFSVERAVRSLAWSHDGQLLAVGGDRPGITVWEAKAKRLGKTFGDLAAHCLAFAPTGTDLASWEIPGSLGLWDAATGKRRWQTIPRSNDPGGAAGLIYQIAFSRDGQFILAGDRRGGLERFDLDGKSVGRILAHQGRVTALAVSSNGLVATGGADHTIRLWRADTFAPILPASQTTGPLIGLSLASKGTRLAGVYGSGEVRLFDVATGHAIESKLPAARAAILGADGKSASLVTPQGRLARWSETSGEEVLAREQPPLTGIASGNGGRVFLTAHSDGHLWLRDKAGRRRQALEGLEHRVVPLLSEDGRLAAAVGQTAYISVWDATTGKVLPRLAGHRGGTLAGAFVGEGRLLSGGRDRMVRLWNVKLAREVRDAILHAAWVTAVAASADGKLLASATKQGDIFVWWGATGQLLAELEGHRGAVSALAVTADGKTLVSAGQDTTILFWDIADLQSGKARPFSISPARAEELWAEMRDASPATASLAMNRLARDPARALATVKGRIHPVDGAKIKRLIALLDSDEFAVRVKASKELAALGRFAEGSLEMGLTRKPSLDVSRELQRLLNRCATAGPTQEHRQALLATDLLELVGTREAIAILKRLAGGAADAELTRRAKKILAKMGKKRVGRADEW